MNKILIRFGCIFKIIWKELREKFHETVGKMLKNSMKILTEICVEFEKN